MADQEDHVMPSPTRTEAIDRVRADLGAIGQSHVLAFWDDLSVEHRRALCAQLASIDLASIPSLVRRYVHQADEETPAADPEPAPYYPVDPLSPRRRWDAEHFRRVGEDLIRAGRIACFTVAGGQGTRLGYDGPKGCYPAGAVTGKGLFQIFAEGIRASERKYGDVIPWYIMTSPQNDAPTRAFFAAHADFGLSHVMFFPQGVMPSFDLASGRMLLSDRHEIATNPDGHGGSFRALVESGATTDMRARGIAHISYFQVDNPMVRVVDPVFLGLHASAEDSSGEMSSKMIAKRSADERVGVFCARDGRLSMIEYSDLPQRLAALREGDGSLVFGAGNPAIHAMSVEFVERVHRDPAFALPFHRAVKKIPHVDPGSGERIDPDTPNGVKLERFVFDALAMATRSIILETDRLEEFAPIKNAQGEDSPASCARLQSERAARWLATIGIQTPRRADGSLDAVLEISPLTACEARDLAGKDPASLMGAHLRGRTIAPGARVAI